MTARPGRAGPTAPAAGEHGGQPTPSARSIIFVCVCILYHGHRGSVVLATGPAPGWGQLTCLWHVTWPQLSNAPPHTHLLAPESTSAKLATWRCQPLIHLPPEASALAVPDPAQLSPHFSLRPQSPAFLWPPPSTWGSLALVTLPPSHHRDRSLSHLPGPTWTPLSGMGCRPERRQTSAASLGSNPPRLVTLAPDCAHSTRPVHCSQGWPGLCVL